MSTDLTRRLSGKSIVLIGGGGIGNEIALRYAREGASVLLADIDPDMVQRAAQALETDAPGRIVTVQCDATDEASVYAAIALAVEQFGGLDGLHANFAAFLDGRLQDGAGELPLSMFDTMVAVNMRGFLLATRATLPPIIARGGGTILYTSSGAAHAAEAVRPFYAMTKAAGHALMRHVASRYGPQGIRANTIAPGIIMHEKLRAHASDGFEDWAKRHVACKTRLGEPQDIAALSALLMSDEGAFITGQVISVDGGSSMRL